MILNHSTRMMNTSQALHAMWELIHQVRISSH
uniref:Uncharacterized protein n=1 Tax=Parascaris equorum TaxID=6256 RepID=A0A914RXD6_PAREQ